MILLILAAGYGTRLYPVAAQMPKALLPVNGKPILQYLVEKVVDPGVGAKEILLVSNHRYADQFTTWLSAQKLRIPWIVLDDGSTSEENRLGSIGDLAFALRTRRFEREEVLVLGSDNLFSDDLKGFAAFARGKTPGITLGAYELPDRSLASRYGVLTIDEQGRLLDLAEKPENPPSALVSTAIYFFPPGQLRRVLEYDGSADTLGSFIHWLIPRETVFAYRLQGPWFDIGDMASYNQAQEQFI